MSMSGGPPSKLVRPYLCLVFSNTEHVERSETASELSETAGEQSEAAGDQIETTGW